MSKGERVKFDMKKTKIDRLGRIVIPIQYRKALGLGENSEINVEYDERKIIITPTALTCRICGVAVSGGYELSLCESCIAKIKETK